MILLCLRMPDLPSTTLHQRPHYQCLGSVRVCLAYDLPSEYRIFPLDVIAHVKQTSFMSNKSSDEIRSVPVTSNVSHDGKSAISAIKDQNRSFDMLKRSPPRCWTTSCLNHYIQKPKVTFTASAQRSVAFEKLVERDREESERIRQQVSGILELQRRQQATIDRIAMSSNPFIQYGPLEMLETQDQMPSIAANVQRQAQGMQQIWTSQRIQATGQHAAEILAMLERSTNHLLQLARKIQEQSQAKEQAIKQQKPLRIDNKIKQEWTGRLRQNGSDQQQQQRRQLNKLTKKELRSTLI